MRKRTARRAAKKTPMSVLILALIAAAIYLWAGDNPVSDAPETSPQTNTSEETSPELKDPETSENQEETKAPTSPVDLNSFTVIDDYKKDGSYQRSIFGKAWDDVDGNGCDTRNDILARDLTNITVNSKCQVMTGTLEKDPYTGESIDFVRGEGACDKTGWNGAPVVYNGKDGGCSTAVTIDHVISLEEAWYVAAHDWSFEKRLAFANDPDNLLPTGANSWKSAKTPSEVASDTKSPMTEEGFCTYLNTYVHVAKKYDLPMTESTYKTVSENLGRCS